MKRITSMKIRQGSVLAVFATIAAGLAMPAHTQGVRIGNRLIPESSIEKPGDVGRRAHTHTQILVGPRGGGVGFLGGLGPAGGLSPAQLRQAYNLPSTGGSQIIAIVDAYDNPNALSDFNTFSAQFGLPQETSTSVTASTNKVFQILYGSGSKPAVDSTGGWELEEALDIEWSHAMAPNAKIILVEAASTSFANLLAAEDTATKYTDGNGWTVKQVSNSWGGSEFSGETSDDSHFSGSSATYFVSAGDDGSPAEYPSASPYVVSAGGTTVTTDSNGNFVSEAGWSDGGGGPSSMESRPAYQSAISSIVGTHRGTPDLSFDADPNTGVSVYDSYKYEGTSYTWIVVGGTSVASPSLAGIANLAATAQGSFPAGSQALLTTIYSNLGSVNFRDITSGNNGYAAAVGWDFVTGVGTCLGLGGLQSAGSGPPQVAISSLSPNSATAGGAAFTLTVNGSGFVTGSIVDWNGASLSTTYISATQLTASVPSTDIAGAGSASVTVANPGGITSSPAAFTIIASGNPVPVLSALSPNSVPRGTRGGYLELIGSNFINGSQVTWKFNGTTYSLSVVYESSTELYAYVPTSLLTSTGTATVTVINPAPGGGPSGSLPFTIIR
jgi:subtilase family serine protease